MQKGGTWSHDILKRRLLSASSLQSKLRTLGNHVADDAIVDVLGMCICAFPIVIGRYKCILTILPLGGLYSYRRGLRSCLSIRGGKFEGQDCEISNEYESHAFSF